MAGASFGHGHPGIAIAVAHEHGIMLASREARCLAERAGFRRAAAYDIATAASELAANLFRHAGGGLLNIALRDDPPRLELLALDRGPGIADLDAALRDGYSSGDGLGCGLPGIRRLMDDFSIVTAPNWGTRARAIKRLPPLARP